MKISWREVGSDLADEARDISAEPWPADECGGRSLGGAHGPKNVRSALFQRTPGAFLSGDADRCSLVSRRHRRRPFDEETSQAPWGRITRDALRFYPGQLPQQTVINIPPRRDGALVELPLCSHRGKRWSMSSIIAPTRSVNTHRSEDYAAEWYSDASPARIARFAWTT